MNTNVDVRREALVGGAVHMSSFIDFDALPNRAFCASSFKVRMARTNLTSLPILLSLYSTFASDRVFFLVSTSTTFRQHVALNAPRRSGYV